VRAFAAGGAGAGSLHGLAAALVARLAADGRALAPGAASALLELEAYLRGAPPPRSPNVV
jgi:hypothetical protein